MKKLLISTLFLATLGCDDDESASHSKRDARFIDVEAPVEDGSLADMSVSDRAQLELDSDLPPVDMGAVSLDSNLVDSGDLDEGVVALDAVVLVDGSADTAPVVVDAALEDM